MGERQEEQEQLNLLSALAEEICRFLLQNVGVGGASAIAEFVAQVQGLGLPAVQRRDSVLYAAARPSPLEYP